ncbi:TIGR02302 family protein [Sedimentitalea arenosa]|uniref:TIGR02302 family protein n=1 Tax=Sedimentitalea arenosa TaxID=2798803 RepID=A0A8J7JEU6_9RHOB|nr:TIGR02302 family protein [Arenibacterium arenosum]MBJ6373034.1 TIGR02302 family protein [Arenibacterium arenosum]
MAEPTAIPPVLHKLRLPLFLTRCGLLAEQLLRGFWPLISVILLAAALLMLGVQDHLPIEAVWVGTVVFALAALVAAISGVRRFVWPTRQMALARLDATLPGRPIQAVMDQQAIGTGDESSMAVWRAHQARMADRAAAAQAPAPDLKLARRDPFALRYVALLAFLVALLFGSIWRVGSVVDMTPGGGDLAGGPTWEGWVEPPRYTGKPTIYMKDIDSAAIEVPVNSRILLRFYGEVGDLTLAETVSGRIGELPPASDPVQDFTVTQDGELRIDGPGGRAWDIRVLSDTPPQITVAGVPEAEATGEMTLPFTASDDYGVVSGEAVIALDLPALTREYGLATDPDPREPVAVPLPMPIAGDRTMFTETLIEDLSKHPWAHLPVTVTLSATDSAGNVTVGEAHAMTLPARRFFDPMAAAVIEMRRDLLWARANAPRVAQVLRAISHRPDEVFRSETAYLRLRVILRRLESLAERDLLAVEAQNEMAEALWDLAILLEEGDLGDALERLRRAQEQLSEAMRNGASDQEIAELMQELRRATDDYLRQLSRQAQQQGQQGEQGQQQAQNSMQMTQDDLQRMMDRIQELMEQGRMAEAEQALQELQQMMENMRVTQGQGQGGQSPGQQAMEGLAETLREQQGLSDQAFRDLQEQFNPGAQAGENEGNQGRNGGQGRGESHEGQGQGRADGQGEGAQPGQPGQPGGQQSLADRQRALRDELSRQQGQMPGAGTPEGDAAREALDRAGRAMDGAEESLRQDDYAGAIDRQSEAMEALREGMRALGEAMAQEQQNQPGQGTTDGDMRAQNRDPLGRDTGSNGSLGTPENLLQGEDVYRRARELLDEIRRRSGDGERPEVELDYLQRLLERF